jgi:hypothetical protein
MAQICDLEILSATGGPASGGRFALNDKRRGFSTASQHYAGRQTLQATSKMNNKHTRAPGIMSVG